MITLVLGGARSGKSAVAERLAAAAGQAAGVAVTYVATMVVGDDVDLSERVAAHRARRPAEWRTVEAGADLAGAIAAVDGPVLVDSLGPWVGLLPEFRDDTEGLDARTTDLCRALRSRNADTILVSDEVGLSPHPTTRLGSRFRDAVGTVNQAVAAVADRALLVVAGRALRLDTAPES